MAPPRMPHNNRMSTSGALQTSSIWQKTIGHDPYAGNTDDKKQPSTEEAAADEAKAKKVLEAARQQNLTGDTSRDDFAQRMYTGLKGGKKRRADLMGGVDTAGQERLEQILQEASSSSEEEFVEVTTEKQAVVDNKRESKKKDVRGKKDRKKKRRRRSSSSHSDGDDDSSSDDSSQRERSRRRMREKRKRKRKHRRHYDSDSDDDSSSSDRDKKRKQKGRKEKKHRRDGDDEKKKSSSGKNRKRDDDKSANKEQYIASAEFAGSKKGYGFRAGERGVGYYLDDKPRVDKKMRDEMLKLYQE